MKVHALLAAALVASVSLHSKTLTFKLGPEGKDALLSSRKDQVDSNFGSSPRLASEAWKFDTLGTGALQSLFQFDLTAIPTYATVTSAKLYLYCDTSNYVHGHSRGVNSFNEAWLMRVTSAWAESTVTWNNQPARKSNGAVKLGTSTSNRLNYTLDMLSMVADMVAHPAANQGFILMAEVERLGTALSFASGDHPDADLHPVLEVEYDDEVDIVKLKPGAEGKDAVVFSRKDLVDSNFGASPRFHAETWTWNNGGQNLGTGTYRSLIEFDLKAVTSTKPLRTALLHLKCDTLNQSKGHTLRNDYNYAWLFRLKEAWEESTATWTHKPAYDSSRIAHLARSETRIQDYEVDVTVMVADMLAHPEKNFGFLLRSVEEAPHRALSFASSDHADTTLHPMLELRFSRTSTRAREDQDRGLSRGIAPAFRLVGREILLDRDASGLVADLRGRVVTRFVNTRTVSLRGLTTGAYLLRAGASTSRFVAP